MKTSFQTRTMSLFVVLILNCFISLSFAQQGSQPYVDPNPNVNQPKPKELPDGLKPEDLVRQVEQPDKSKGEVSVLTIRVKPDGWLLQRSTMYDGKGPVDVKVEEFRTAPDSEYTLNTEITSSHKPTATIGMTYYREDGKTVKCTQTDTKAGRVAKYFSRDGKQLLRNVTPDGTMFVTVSDKSNKKLYLQKWLLLPAGGWQLHSTVEYLNDVAVRRIFPDDDQVDHVDILNPDGTVKATEKADGLSQPVDATLLDELNREDDVTAGSKPAAAPGTVPIPL